MLDVQTRATTVGGVDLPGRNLLAARVTQNIFDQSKIGLIFTNGSPTGEKNSLAGFDFNFSSSKFLGDKNLMLATWAVYNWNETEEGRHHGFGFRANYPNDLWNVQTTYAYYGEALDPGLGYMMRQGIQTGYVRVAFQPRPKGGFLTGFVRQFYFDVSADYYWDLAGGLETSTLSASPLSFRTQSGESFSFSAVANHDVLPFDFEVSEGVVLPAGPYSFTSFRLNASSASHRPIVVDAGWNFGEFYSGRYDDVNLGLTLKFKGYATLAFDANLVRGRLPEGNFSENVFQVKADIFLSPDLGFMNYIQFDDISNTLGWNARLRWQTLARQRDLPRLQQELGAHLGPEEPVQPPRRPRCRQDLAVDPALAARVWGRPPSVPSVKNVADRCKEPGFSALPSRGGTGEIAVPPLGMFFARKHSSRL